MREIKQTAESPQAVPVERPAESAPPAKPAHSAVGRVTEKKAKDPKKVAAGCPGTTARRKRLFEQLQAAKESLHPPLAQLTTTARLLLQRQRSRQNTQTNRQNITITGLHGACLAGGSLAYIFAGFACRTMRLRASPASVAAGPAPKVQDKPLQLKACPDPKYMK